MKKMIVCIFAVILAAALAVLILFEKERFVQKEFTSGSDYNEWAYNVGYGSGLLVPLGYDGISHDYFRSLPGSDGYASGRIVIGDSRCCQLGIYRQRSGGKDLAAFAVWGGHYISGSMSPIINEEHWNDIELCFKKQIEVCGRCVIYFFATVNDYDPTGKENDKSVSSAIAAAEKCASLKYEKDGKVYRPRVVVVGFEGWASREAGDDINRYVQSYNQKLYNAVKASEKLKRDADSFTTVSEITDGKTGFISDAIHYSDETLEKLTSFIVEK